MGARYAGLLSARMQSTLPRSVLISGASTGIGKATALHLAERGWRVFAGVRRPVDGEHLRTESRLKVEPVFLAVADAGSVRTAVIRVTDALAGAGLNGLVNNAGIGVPGPVEATPLEMWRRQFEVNFFGVIGLTQACLPLLRGPRGRVVITSSIAGLLGQPFMGPYCASKHAVEALGDALRMELAPQGLGVTLIEPGAIRTPIWQRATGAAEEIRAGWAEDHRRLYSGPLETVKAAAAKAEARGIAPLVCARAVERALTAGRAPGRIVVGRDAKMGALLGRVLPTRVMDWVMMKNYGLR